MIREEEPKPQPELISSFEIDGVRVKMELTRVGDREFLHVEDEHGRMLVVGKNIKEIKKMIEKGKEVMRRAEI